MSIEKWFIILSKSNIRISFYREVKLRRLLTYTMLDKYDRNQFEERTEKTKSTRL